MPAMPRMCSCALVVRSVSCATISPSLERRRMTAAARPAATSKSPALDTTSVKDRLSYGGTRNSVRLQHGICPEPSQQR